MAVELLSWRIWAEHEGREHAEQVTSAFFATFAEIAQREADKRFEAAEDKESWSCILIVEQDGLTGGTVTRRFGFRAQPELVVVREMLELT